MDKQSQTGMDYNTSLLKTIRTACNLVYHNDYGNIIGEFLAPVYIAGKPSMGVL